ncbi:MAG: lipoprotein [Pseudomonadota bacterium]|nr:lipoprotein [Pseudomonadota bacterium]
MKKVCLILICLSVMTFVSCGIKGPLTLPTNDETEYAS